MTDNRTNEELAARMRQLAESQAMDFDSPHIAMTLTEVADRLVAAAGAAPQAESECLCYGADGVTEPKCPTCAAANSSTATCDRDHMGICKRCGNGWDARKVLDGDLACPVMPSSTVDEGKIAEVEALHVPGALAECQECEGNRWPCPTVRALGSVPSTGEGNDAVQGS